MSKIEQPVDRCATMARESSTEVAHSSCPQNRHELSTPLLRFFPRQFFGKVKVKGKATSKARTLKATSNPFIYKTSQMRKAKAKARQIPSIQHYKNSMKVLSGNEKNYGAEVGGGTSKLTSKVQETRPKWHPGNDNKGHPARPIRPSRQPLRHQ